MLGPGGQSSDSVMYQRDHTKETESEFCPPGHQLNSVFSKNIKFLKKIAYFQFESKLLLKNI
jgi:hypothetical protein